MIQSCPCSTQVAIGTPVLKDANVQSLISGRMPVVNGQKQGKNQLRHNQVALGQMDSPEFLGC